MRTQLQKILPFIAVTLGSVTSVFSHNPGGKPDPMNASLQPLKGAEFEQSFLQQMIQHHRSALDMAKLASESHQTPGASGIRGENDRGTAAGNRADDEMVGRVVQSFSKRSRERS